MAERPTLNDVLTLARRGWAVFPMSGKTPLVKWRAESTTDEDALRAMFQEHSHHGFPNVGIDCGKSGLVVIDLDVGADKDGKEAWEKLKEEHGFDDSGALVTRTGSGGQHLIFKDPTGGRIGNSAGQLGPGIDVRGEGGCIVAPPSIHPDTDTPYFWSAGDGVPNDLPLAVVDLLLAKDKLEAECKKPAHVDATTRDVAYARAALQAETAGVAAAAAGGRNDQLNKAAFSLGQLVATGLLDDAEVKRQLQGAAVSCGLVVDDGQQAVERTIESGLAAGKGAPRQLPDPESRSAAAEAESEELAIGTAFTPIEKAGVGETVRQHLVSAALDDEGNADSVFQLYKNRFVFCPSYGWLQYNGRYWDRTNAEARLTRAIVDTLETRAQFAIAADRPEMLKGLKRSRHKVNSCKDLFRSRVTVDVARFDREPFLLNASNGVIDLRTGELRPSRPEDFFTYCLPNEYDREADPAPWLTFLREVLNDDWEMIEFLQEAVGYSITGDTKEECLFYIHGPTRAGKGVFVETIMAMLAKEPMAAEVDFGTFTRSRDHDAQNFDLAPLKPCRFVAASESAEFEVLNGPMLKRITGGNDIRCAFKYKDYFTYRPQFKIWLSSNYPPNVNVTDTAAWNRLRVITFPNSYAGNEDKYLKARLRKPEVLSGVLLWAVQGAVRWHERGSNGLPVPEQVAEATKAARYELDYVEQWLEDCTKEDEGRFVPNNELYGSYQSWCENNGVLSEGKRALTSILKQKGYKAGESKWHNGKSQRGCENIRLTETLRPYDTLH